MRAKAAAWTIMVFVISIITYWKWILVVFAAAVFIILLVPEEVLQLDDAQDPDCGHWLPAKAGGCQEQHEPSRSHHSSSAASPNVTDSRQIQIHLPSISSALTTSLYVFAAAQR